MTRNLEFSDIQGNIIRAYGRYGFPVVRYFFLSFDKDKSHEVRIFVDTVRRRVTTSTRWGEGKGKVPKPKVTLNIGLSWYGLMALGLPTRTLAGLPSEFIEGMRRRAHILGDVGPSDPENWDPIWQNSAPESGNQVHAWISMNAQIGSDLEPVRELDEQTTWFRDAIKNSDGGVKLLSGHGSDGDQDYQEASVLWAKNSEGLPMPTSKEHFGFNDGIGSPVFENQFEPEIENVRAIGRGKLMPDQTWEPLATGEFILGHVDESQELPPITVPASFMRNGTFMAYRKLHENVKTFTRYVAEQAKTYARVMDVPVKEADDTIRAKMVGRWANGVPLAKAPTYDDWLQFNEKWLDIEEIQFQKTRGQRISDEQKDRLAEYRKILIDFKYDDDVEGYKCPVSAHIRRANTRDMLDPELNTDSASGSSLTKRRRILRRGLPYGKYDPDNPTNDGNHGIIFMAICASLNRQFEFVQQQWIQYGQDFNVGNDTCPVIGKHDKGDKFVIASDPKTGKPPYICANPPPFVTTKGGEYFFIPSLTALRMIAMGTVDPT